MAYETMIYKKQKGIAILTLNRPDQLNSVNTVMQKEMKEIWSDIEGDRNIRVIIITGGDKCFCAGADIKEKFPPGESRPSSRDMFKKIEDYDGPTIAAISGYCLGGGLELALCCDQCIASETARLGLAEIKIGAAPGAGGMQRLPRLIGIPKAKEMLYTGDPVNAEEAHRIGLVNKVIPAASLMEEVRKLAELFLERPPHSLRIAKRCVNEGMQVDLNTALKLDVAITASEMSTPTASENLLEGRQAFREKRKPVFKR